MMATSHLLSFGVVSGVLGSMLGGIAAFWVQGELKAKIDPHVEKACFSAVAERTPLGHRAIATYSYQEESSKLGIANGGVEAQYARSQWTQVTWTCRINPTNRKVARIEFAPANGGHRLRSAASAF